MSGGCCAVMMITLSVEENREIARPTLAVVNHPVTGRAGQIDGRVRHRMPICQNTVMSAVLKRLRNAAGVRCVRRVNSRENVATSR